MKSVEILNRIVLLLKLDCVIFDANKPASKYFFKIFNDYLARSKTIYEFYKTLQSSPI